MMYLAPAFQREMENHFTVVQWDRRGAGKSYREDLPVASMNVEQIINDTHELAQLLRNWFRQPKLYLVGHSWGLLSRHADDQRYQNLFHAYVGIGQLAYLAEQNSAAQERFIPQRTQVTCNEEALKELKKGGVRCAPLGTIRASC